MAVWAILALLLPNLGNIQHGREGGEKQGGREGSMCSQMVWLMDMEVGAPVGERLNNAPTSYPRLIQTHFSSNKRTLSLVCTQSNLLLSGADTQNHTSEGNAEKRFKSDPFDWGDGEKLLQSELRQVDPKIIISPVFWRIVIPPSMPQPTAPRGDVKAKQRFLRCTCTHQPDVHSPHTLRVAL